MNWEAAGAIGEILAAVAVVVTLVYLSRQIRQGYKAVQVSALRDTTAQWNHWSQLLATSPGLAEIVARGNHSYKNLPEADALRYAAFVQTFFDNVESYRTLVIEHDVEKDIDVLEAIVARRVAIQGFSEWWDENAADYDASFGRWIDSLRNKNN